MLMWLFKTTLYGFAMTDYGELTGNLKDMVAYMRTRLGVLDWPIEIHAHPELATVVKEIIEAEGIEYVTVVEDNGLLVTTMDDGRKQSDLLFYGEEE